MKRRRHKNKPAAPANEPVDRWGATGLQSLRSLAGLFSLVIVIGAAVYGLERLKGRVYALPEYNPPVKVELAEPPAWVEQEQWSPRILSSIRLDSITSGLDEMLVRQVADQINRSGWVAAVKRVTQNMDGTIRIACDYRRPIAMVQTRRGYIPVDRHGVRLPEVYQQVPDGSGWMCLFGVKAETPEVGEPFQGDDAVAAIRLACVLFDQDFARRIVAIDVQNFRGRINKHDTHICLRTLDRGRIDWGSAIGEEIEEPSVQDKLRTIALYFKKGSSHAQVDVSVYRNGWIEPRERDVRTADGAMSRDR